MAKYILVFLILFLALTGGCYNSTYGTPSKLEPPRYTQVAPIPASPRKVIHTVVDKNFGESDRLAIDDAINAWNYVLNNYIVIKVESYNFDMEVDVLKRIISQHGLVILKVDHTSPLIPDSGKKYTTLAWANELGGTKIWVVRDRLYPVDMFPIMLHEIGHILGADHEKDVPENSGFLMFPHYERGKYNCVDGRAMEKVAFYQMILPERLNYCY